MKPGLQEQRFCPRNVEPKSVDQNDWQPLDIPFEATTELYIIFST